MSGFSRPFLEPCHWDEPTLFPRWRQALINTYYNTAADLGVQIVYEAQVKHVEIENGRFQAVEVEIGGAAPCRVEGRTIVLASGGFQADIEWLARAWGPAARNFLIRGTPYNRGVVLKDLLDQGADSVGDPTQCHAVAIDGRAPKFDGGIVTRLDCVPFSIVVNKHGKRFYDEGEDVWPKRYAIWGRLVAAQPDQVAYSIIDAKSSTLFMPSVFRQRRRIRGGWQKNWAFPQRSYERQLIYSTRPAVRGLSPDGA